MYAHTTPRQAGRSAARLTRRAHRGLAPGEGDAEAEGGGAGGRRSPITPSPRESVRYVDIVRVIWVRRGKGVHPSAAVTKRTTRVRV